MPPSTRVCSRIALIAIGLSLAPIAFGQIYRDGRRPESDRSSRINAELGLSASSIVSLDALQKTSTGATASILLDDKPRTITLHRHSVRAPQYQVLVQQLDGTLIPTTPGPLTTYRGVVEEIPGSEVAASLSDDGLEALILLPGRSRIWIEPIGGTVAGAGSRDHIVYSDEDRLDTPFCGTKTPLLDVPSRNAAPLRTFQNDTRWAEIAIDTDVEYYELRGSVEAVESEINEVINISNIQYKRDVNISHSIVTIVIRPTEPDPYLSSQPGNLLMEFRDEWDIFHRTFHRDVAQLFTGRAFSGGVAGIAYYSGICDDADSYSVVSRLAQFCGLLACRTDLTSHELGHNWSAAHCACPDYTMNAVIRSMNQFHPDFTIPSILNYRDSRTCLDVGDTLINLTVEASSDPIAESNSASFAAIADYEFAPDDDVAELAEWSVSPPTLGAMDANGVFTAASVDGTASGTVTAIYTFDSTTLEASAPITIVDAAPAPAPDAQPEKIRYIAFSAPQTGGETAIEVTLSALHRPDPPYHENFHVPDFSSFEGEVRWVGEPQTCEGPNGIGEFTCARLECEPYFSANWGKDLVYVTGAEIIPSSSYEVRTVPQECGDSPSDCAVKSHPLRIETQRWGDVAPPYQVHGGPSSTVNQPNVLDISATIQVLSEEPGALAPVYAHVYPNHISPAGSINVLDLANVVGAVKDVPYPFDGPCLCPPTRTCPYLDSCGRCKPRP